ncbi:MAG: TPM domain-containing protein, partial [Cyanobacteria bacterium]|nr:TPM domain-containing protein [Cyanobacteriota bacterium]
PQVFTDVAPNGAKIPFVNNAKDLPQLKPTIKQDVVDLMNNPLLSPAAKRDIESMIQDLRAKGVGQMSVVVIPNTQNRELNTLSTDIFNQMGIGEKGKNNGVLILVNANNMRENKSPRMNINPGIGFEKTLSQTVTADIMLKHAAPHMKNKDYDGAVRDVVKAVKEYLEANQPKTGVTGADGGNGSTVSDPNAAGTGAEVILTLLAALAVTAGGVGAGVYLHNRKKKFEEAAAIVTKPLNEMESGYKVTRANIYTAKTVEALLTTDRIRPNQHSLLSALELVEANLPPTEEATLTKTYIEKGISHASPEIRIHFINRLSKKDVAANDVDRSVLSALLAQLELEKEPKVINALGTPIIAMAGAQQVPLFESKLSNPEPAIRQLSLGILKKFATIETPPKFFTLIETEKDNNLVELLQVYLTQLATPELRPLYLDKLTKTPAGEKQQAIHKAAIQGLGKIANSSDFPALFEGFKKDSALYLDKSYQEALDATVNKSQINVIQTGLEHPEARVQLTSLALLAKFPSPYLVAPLFTYYEKVAAENNEKLAGKAGALLKKSVDSTNRVLLLNKLDASSAGVKRLALQGLTQVAKSEDVPKLFAVLSTPDGPALAEDVQDVLNHAVDSSQRNFLESNFTAASPEVRYAAAVGFKKIAIPQDLVKALKAYQAESTAKVEQAFAQLVGDVSDEKENFKPLSQFLTTEKTMNKARVLVAEDIVAHGTKALNPLF